MRSWVDGVAGFQYGRWGDAMSWLLGLGPVAAVHEGGRIGSCAIPASPAWRLCAFGTPLQLLSI